MGGVPRGGGAEGKIGCLQRGEVVGCIEKSTVEFDRRR